MLGKSHHSITQDASKMQSEGSKLTLEKILRQNSRLSSVLGELDQHIFLNKNYNLINQVIYLSSTFARSDLPSCCPATPFVKSGFLNFPLEWRDLNKVFMSMIFKGWHNCNFEIDAHLNYQYNFLDSEQRYYKRSIS